MTVPYRFAIVGGGLAPVLSPYCQALPRCSRWMAWSQSGQGVIGRNGACTFRTVDAMLAACEPEFVLPIAWSRTNAGAARAAGAVLSGPPADLARLQQRALLRSADGLRTVYLQPHHAARLALYSGMLGKISQVQVSILSATTV